MTTCTRHLDDGDLVCTQEQGHEHGCVFKNSTGSDVDDRHVGGGHG